MLYFIIGGVVLLAVISIVVIYFYNQFQFSIIKIEEAENNIDLLLEKKLELLNRIAPLIQERTKEETCFVELPKLKIKKLDHFDLRDALKKLDRELTERLDTNQEIEKDQKMKSILEEMLENNIDLDAAIKYYNDNVVIFNKLIRCFPSNLLRLIWHYKTKDFYSDEKEEMFEILKK